MSAVTRQPVPENALHAKYARESGHADCFVADVSREVTHAEYVESFYTTWLFKLERLILTWLVSKPSTDAEARAVARGERDQFAAWFLEARAPNELVMHDFQDKTRSWFKVERLPGAGTRLYFGTGIKPVKRRNGAREIGSSFRLLMGVHLLYSRALLSAARSRLERSRR